MISRSTIKFIKSLQLKKYRYQEQSFLVEGEKSVLEVLTSEYEIRELYVTEPFLLSNPEIENELIATIVTERELNSISNFKTNTSALAVVSFKESGDINILDEIGLVLDDIRDPGNLGAILRIADWYGIKKIFCSTETTDIYSPKVIASSMGSFARIEWEYGDITSFLAKNNEISIYGAFLDGMSVHDVDFQKSSLIIIGNESSGIRDEVAKFVSQKITIPKYGNAESLNAAMATAIICDNIRRTG